MVDYSVDGSFDIYFTENDDFAEVSGLDEFEEDLVVTINDRFKDIISGYTNLDTAIEKVKLLTVRLAREFDIIDQVKQLLVYEPIDKPQTLSIEITYTSGATFEETI